MARVAALDDVLYNEQRATALRREDVCPMVSLLEEEIVSQPGVIARLLDHELEHIQRIAAHLTPFRFVVIAARGSSDHAALYAKYAWGALAGYPVALAAPALYSLYGAPPKLADALVIGISQSGQSPDIVAVLADAKRQGCPTLAISNDASSPLAAAADSVISLHAGAERSVAATKTYTAELVAMAALAACLSHEAARLEELKWLPEAAEAALAAAFDTAPHAAEAWRAYDRCVVLGRGYNFATASELALKLKELTYVTASAYSSADFRHGPIATVEPGSAALLVMPQGAAYADLAALAAELRERGADLAVISDAAEALALAATPLPLAAADPPIPEWLSPVTAIMPGQVLALRLAEAKGLDPDLPRGLRKVTRTL
jgi:glutamine---fructose-6-phosphate transaminase (isomerizing)